MSLSVLLLVLLVVLLVGAVPAYPWNREWGWGPSGGLVTVLLVVVLLMVLGVLPRHF